jgi:hypothetical protein
VLPDGKFGVIGVWSGTYRVEDSTLSLIPDEETDVSLTPEPQDFLEMTSGITDVEHNSSL